MKPQTMTQVLRCLTIGRYTARVEADELRIRGPLPLAGPLPASVKARRDDLVTFLEGWCGGVWPAARRSHLREVGRGLRGGISVALDAVEESWREGAA